MNEGLLYYGIIFLVSFVNVGIFGGLAFWLLKKIMPAKPAAMLALVVIFGLNVWGWSSSQDIGVKVIVFIPAFIVFECIWLASDKKTKPNGNSAGPNSCPTCGENNNPVFTTCWKCKSPLESTPSKPKETASIYERAFEAFSAKQEAALPLLKEAALSDEIPRQDQSYLLPGIASFLLAMRQTDLGIKMCEKALRLEPKNYLTLSMLLGTYAKSGDQNKALEICRALLDADYVNYIDKCKNVFSKSSLPAVRDGGGDDAITMYKNLGEMFSSMGFVKEAERAGAIAAHIKSML